MSHITTCPRCSRCYTETCEEDVNSPDRRCTHCWLGIRSPVRRARADLDNQAVSHNRPAPTPGSSAPAFKGCGEGGEEGRPAAGQTSAEVVPC